MKKTIFVSAVLTVGACSILLMAAPAFCQDPATEKVEEPAEKTKIEVSDQVIDEELPSLRTNLKDVIFEAEQNIKNVNRQLKVEGDDKAVREHIDKGCSLYNGGKAAEAKREWEDALKLSTDPAVRGQMKANIRMASRQMKEDECKKARNAALQAVPEKVRERARRDAERDAARCKREMERQRCDSGRMAKKEAAKRQRECQQTRAANEQQCRVMRHPQAKPQQAAIVYPAQPDMSNRTEPILVTGKAVSQMSTPAKAKIDLSNRTDLSGLYNEGVSMYLDDKYDEAKARFERIRQLQPHYVRTDDYLEKLKDK